MMLHDFWGGPGRLLRTASASGFAVAVVHVTGSATAPPTNSGILENL